MIAGHIGLYVNNYTLDLGVSGKKSVETLFAKAKSLGLIDDTENSLFLPSNKRILL